MGPASRDPTDKTAYTVTSDSPTQRPPDIYPCALKEGSPGGRDHLFTADHLWQSAPLRRASLPSQDFLWRPRHLSLTVPLAPAPAFWLDVHWAEPLKGPPFLCHLCTHGVNPRPPRRQPETANTRAAAEQRDVFTLHPELQLDLQQKQKYCNVYFFPEMIIIVLQTFFELQLPKWKRHLKK